MGIRTNPPVEAYTNYLMRGVRPEHILLLLSNYIDLELSALGYSSDAEKRDIIAITGLIISSLSLPEEGIETLPHFISSSVRHCRQEYLNQETLPARLASVCVQIAKSTGDGSINKDCLEQNLGVTYTTDKIIQAIIDQKS